jgi:hypothetical protein
MIRLEGYDKGFSERWDCQPSVIVDGDTAANTYMLRQQQQTSRYSLIRSYWGSGVAPSHRQDF